MKLVFLSPNSLALSFIFLTKDSQIFLKVGEKMSVTDMVKGISIASGNDATVAMAERISGSEESFVKKMNDRATVSCFVSKSCLKSIYSRIESY